MAGRFRRRLTFVKIFMTKIHVNNEANRMSSVRAISLDTISSYKVYPPMTANSHGYRENLRVLRRSCKPYRPSGFGKKTPFQHGDAGNAADPAFSKFSVVVLRVFAAFGLRLQRITCRS